MNLKKHDPTLLEKKRQKLKPFIHRYEEKIETLNSLRLSFGLSFLACLFLSSLWPLHLYNPLSYITLGFFFSFLFFVRLSLKVKAFIKKLKEYFLYLERQQLRQEGRSIPPSYPLNQEGFSFLKIPDQAPLDLNLVGEHSLLSLLSECWTSKGLQELLNRVCYQKINSPTIVASQKITQSLREIAWPLLRLRIKLSTEKQSHKTHTSLDDQSIDFYLNLAIWKNSPSKKIFFLLALWFLWMITLGSGLAQKLSFGNIIFLSFPLTNLFFLKHWSDYFQSLLGLEANMNQTLSSFQFIKKYSFCFAIKELFPASLEHSPEKTLKKIHHAFLFLGTQVHPLLHFIVNSFMPWSALGAFLAFRALHQNFIKESLQELPRLEWLASLMTFERYQTAMYPEIQDPSPYAMLSFEDLYHPLLLRSEVVTNSFTSSQKNSLILLTGSNMSGKSTFLRAMGINQILCNAGLPVFAKKMVTGPYLVQTCIQVTDSVRDGFSYFYSEVRRLKHMSESMEDSKTPCLNLVDELFRGTNNSERRLGSRALIQKWAEKKHCVSFVSSHDLDLAQEALSFEKVSCFHFKDTVNPDSGLMTFDYKLYPGPSLTTNALKIMLMEKLIESDDLNTSKSLS
jgi:hypothetical protein